MDGKAAWSCDTAGSKDQHTQVSPLASACFSSPGCVTPKTADQRSRHAAPSPHCTVLLAAASLPCMLVSSRPAVSHASTASELRNPAPQGPFPMLSTAASVSQPTHHAPRPVKFQRETHLLESGVWTSSTSLMWPPASRPSSYLVSTSSRPLLSASAWPLANSRSARADACTQHGQC